MARARAVGGRLSETLVDARGGLDLDALDRALALLQRDGDLELRGAGAETIYTVPDERRPRLAFYRNNAVHLFVADSLVCLALAGGAATRPELRRRTLALSRLLKLEFTYRVGETFESIFDRTLGGLAAAGLLVESAEVRVAPGQEERVALLAGQVRDFVESYWVAARAIEGLSAPVADKELLRRIHDLGERLYFTGEVRRREACLRASYQNAVDYFTERGLLIADEGKLRLAPAADPRGVAAEIAALLPRDS
jgi:glycerol-3-phosphate O-acyltransferase